MNPDTSIDIQMWLASFKTSFSRQTSWPWDWPMAPSSSSRGLGSLSLGPRFWKRLAWRAFFNAGKREELKQVFSSKVRTIHILDFIASIARSLADLKCECSLNLNPVKSFLWKKIAQSFLCLGDFFARIFWSRFFFLPERSFSERFGPGCFVLFNGAF